MPRVFWRTDDSNRQVFENIESFEAYLAQSVPAPFALLLNLVFSLLLYAEYLLEEFNNVTPGSYRGIFYRRFGPLNSSIEILRQIFGPNNRWGISRVIHDPEEPRWPRHYDLD